MLLACSERRSILVVKAQECGGFLAGCQVTYERPHSAGIVKPRENLIVRYKGPSPNEELNNLAIASGKFSRYRNDPRITNEQFEKLYLTWIQKCADGQLADQVLVSQNGGKIAGMVAIKKKDHEGSIILISVDEQHRRANIGTDLVAGALAANAELGCSKHSVVTYLENAAACRLFEKSGYEANSKLNFFHFWL